MIDTRNYVASDTLKDGTTVTVRAIRADDREALLAAFGALTRVDLHPLLHVQEGTDRGGCDNAPHLGRRVLEHVRHPTSPKTSYRYLRGDGALPTS